MITEIKQLQELIRRDYMVPRFVELTINDNPELMPQNIRLKDCLLPLLKDYEIAKKREAYCIELVKYFTNYGCLFPYMNNPDKQEFMNDVAAALPEEHWTVFYKATATYGPSSPNPTRTLEKK